MPFRESLWNARTFRHSDSTVGTVKHVERMPKRILRHPNGANAMCQTTANAGCRNRNMGFATSGLSVDKRYLQRYLQ